MSNLQLAKLQLAKQRQDEIARKRKGNEILDTGVDGSQWARMTGEMKLLRQGHFLKTGGRARLDFLREEIRKAKARNKAQDVIVLIKR